jgi:hypothetical protein
MNWSKDMQTPQIQPQNTRIAAVVYPGSQANIAPVQPLFDKALWQRAAHLDQNLSSAAKHRTYSLVVLTDQFGFGHPNLEHIEKVLGNIRTGRTSGYIKQLKVNGWITVQVEKLEPLKTSNNYQLRFPDGFQEMEFRNFYGIYTTNVGGNY